MTAWLLASLGLASVGQGLEASWKREAMLRAERIQEADATNPCERMLTTAFVLHLSKPELVHKANDRAEFFHVSISASAAKNKDAPVFDLAYVYDRRTSELVGARVTRLPDKWILAFLESDKILVHEPAGCVYELDVKQPFAARASSRTPP